MRNALKQARFWKFNESSILPFGKYKGRAVIDIFKEDPSYITFCINCVSKFVLTTKAWNCLYEINSAALFEDKQTIIHHINKHLELYRILKENAHLDDNRDQEESFFSKKIISFEQKTPVIRTKLGRARKKVTDNSGNHVEVERTFNSKSFSAKESEENRASFGIQIIDYKDLFMFRKYDQRYNEGGLRVFETTKLMPCGIIALVFTLDYREFKAVEEAPFGGNSTIYLLPDEAECLLYIANSKLTLENAVLGERDMTQLEVEEESILLREKYKDVWYYDADGELCRHELPEIKTRTEVYGTLNQLDKLLEKYSLYRKAFPNDNIILNTDLRWDCNILNFHLQAEEVDCLVKEWYKSKNNLQQYEYRADALYAALRSRWREENAMVDEPDYDRESWEELTDGQEGDWEDWHDPRE